MPKAKSQRLSSLGEFGWLKSLIPRLYWPASLKSQLCVGPGDDAGALRITPGKVLVATTDAMVEGLHFERKWFPWHSLGEKIMAVNLSDLAAMGDVKPLAALVTAAFPGDTPVDNVDKFYKGLENCAQQWKTGLLGGDTVGSKKDWFVSVTVFGEANPKGLIKRSGAKLGDYLVTTGSLGLAGAGLEVLQSRKTGLRWARPLVKAFSSPQPRFFAGQVLGRRHLATSLIDSSDGLEASVRLLSEASGLGVEVDLGDLPVPAALKRWATIHRRDPWSYALSGGEDYELIFTVNPTLWPVVKSVIPGVVKIGRMVPRRQGCTALSPAGERHPLKGYGFSHFGV
jgi:thiamine-monophosphate kinase